MSKFQKIKTKVVEGKNAVAAVAAGTVGAVASTPAFAALDLSGVSIDTTDYMTIAGFLIAGLVAFWGVKKGISLIR